MNKNLNWYFLLKVSLALMLVAFGIAGITNYNSDMSQFNRAVGKVLGQGNKVFPILFAIVQLASGIVLLLSLFALIPKTILSITQLSILIMWALYILLTYILHGFLEPDFINWLAQFSSQLVILVSIGITYNAE